MKRAVCLSLGFALLETGLGVSGQPSQPPALQDRPGAAELLEVPVSGNPVSDQAPPDIRNPYAGDPNAVVQGKNLFAKMNCNGCHAPLGGGGMGPPLSDPEWIYGDGPASIYLSIVQGRPNGMPAWGRSLPAGAIWSLVAYVQTLSQAPPSASGTPEQPAHPAHPVPNPMGLP